MELRWKGSRAELLANLRKLPGVLAGKEADNFGLRKILLAHIGNQLLDEIQSAFREKSSGRTGSDGITWPELKEATLERRRRKGYSHEDILKETGELYASLTPDPSNDPDAVRIFGQVFEIDSRGVTVGAGGLKADTHQYGGGHVPPRPITPDSMPDAWLDGLDEAMERGMLAVLEEMVLRGRIL